MTATNHALTGSIIGLLIHAPYIALPLAFVSHFICDALPHYDSAAETDQYLQSHAFKRYLVIDASICLAIVLVLATLRPSHWQIASICAFLATSPDLFWIRRFRLVHKGKEWIPNTFEQFAAKIQWFARPIGGVVETTWGIACILVLSILLKK